MTLPFLTEGEQEKFRELYLKGYSASLIFEQLGKILKNRRDANVVMQRYIRSLKLPKRGLRFKGIRRFTHPKPSSEEMATRKQAEFEKILRSIAFHEKRLKQLRNMLNEIL